LDGVNGEVEALVERALRELCAPLVRAEDGSGLVPDLCGGRKIDEAAEGRRRRGLFRTQYRAVESEVVGLGVKW
jgi:hypothetical protein